VVTAESNVNVIRSASNIPKVETSIAGSLNVYDVINADTLVITQDAVRKIEEVLGNA
jgi:large subunit ribosomal protein L4